ncbi:protein FAM180A-like [Chanos chanos]|uniref:Protein FAM180A-like n=1 Tax=Chanos chanos TaxID=29144 RepID=A0A6J2WQ09_CHACN|nr:protein FAM180A-like [Chanos chanos]
MHINMVPWEVILLSLLYCNSYMLAAHHRNQALYPPALRMKRGMALKPIFQNSISDVNLLYEILLTGLRFEDEQGRFSVPDPELASLRQTQRLETICKDVLPKNLSSVRRLTSDLSQRGGTLQHDDFEYAVLTLLYTAHQMAKASTLHQRDAWAESFVDLYRAIKTDLTAK